MPTSQIAAAVPYVWPYDSSLSRETTALVIIDMQNDFLTEGGYISHQGYDISASRAIIPAVQSLLHTFRKAGWQVYHTREGRTISFNFCSLLFDLRPDHLRQATVLICRHYHLGKLSVLATTPRNKA